MKTRSRDHRFFSCRISVLTILVLGSVIMSQAQVKDSIQIVQAKDSLQVMKANDTILVKSFPDSLFRFNVKTPNPKRSGLYSACFPGLGQIYNKQYWKAGVVYAGGAVIGGFIISNYSNYNKYRKAYVGMIDNDPETPNTVENYTVDDVKFLRDGFRRYLEYSIIAATLGYTLNILDAFIAGHLRTFDMSKDISFKARPFITPQKQTGLKVSFCLK